MSENPILIIELDSVPGTRAFYTPEEIKEYLKHEQQYWSWVGEYSKKDGNFLPIYKHQVEWIPKALGLVLEHLIPANNETDRKSALSRIENVIRHAYKDLKAIASQSAKARFVAEKYKANPGVGAHVLAYFINGHAIDNSTSAVQATVEAYLFEQGYHNNISSERAALGALHKEFTDQAAIAKRQNQDFEGIRGNYKETVKESLETLQNKLEKHFKDADSRLSTVTSNFEKRVEELEKFYKEKLSLQSSVSYWRRRRDGHRICSTAFAGLALVVAGVLTWFGWRFLTEVLNVRGRVGVNGEALELAHWEIACTLVLLFLGLWIIRIFVRLLFTHVHLGVDASERVTMLETFLALMQEGKVREDADRHLILGALFRHSTTGLVKDDSAPQLPSDSLIKQFQK